MVCTASATPSRSACTPLNRRSVTSTPMWSGSKAPSAPPSGTLDAMADIKHVVLIHGTWLRGDSWADTRAEFEQRGCTVPTPHIRFSDPRLQAGAHTAGP